MGSPAWRRLAEWAQDEPCIGAHLEGIKSSILPWVCPHRTGHHRIVSPRDYNYVICYLCIVCYTVNPYVPT